MCCGGGKSITNNYLVKGKTREERLKELQDRHNNSSLSIAHEVVIKKNENKLKKSSKKT